MDFYSDPNAGTKTDWSKLDVREVTSSRTSTV